MKTRVRNFGIQNLKTFGIRNPWAWNPESNLGNPESTTPLDSFTWGEVGALWQKPADNSKSHPLEPAHPLEVDQKCRYTEEPKQKFTDQETRNIDEPDPKFTDQDLLLVNLPTENRFSVLQEPDSRHREVSSQKINPPKTNQNESAIINANRHAVFLCDSNGKFLDTKRMFPPNQEVHYSWCPKIENARATLHNDINDSPQLLLIHTETNDLSIATPIAEFIAELSTLITEAATKFPASKIIYSTLLPCTDIPIPIITRINEQLITECSRLPNVHLINHANLFAEGIDLLHDTKHI